MPSPTRPTTDAARSLKCTGATPVLALPARIYFILRPRFAAVEWYVLVGGRQPVAQAKPTPRVMEQSTEVPTADEQAADDALEVLYQHRVG